MRLIISTVMEIKVLKNVLLLLMRNKACVFENRKLRRIFGPKRDENREFRRFHNKELRFCRSYNIATVRKSRRLRWAGM